MPDPVLRIALPTPFTVGPVNAYLLPGEPVTLVDCGPLTRDAWDTLLARLKDQGVDAERIERLVLTHPHQDHAGLAWRLRERSGCRVYAHPVDHPRLLDRPGVWDGIVGFLDEVCRRAGVPEELRRVMTESLRGLRRYTEPLDAIEPLEEGDTLPSDRGRWQVLHTPGHARGAVCLWHEDLGVLVSGDTLIPHISSNAILEPGTDAFRERTLPRYLETLKRIMRLGVRRVFPGHGEPMGDPSDLIRKRLAFHEKRCREVLSLVSKGARSPWEIAEVLFPDLDPGYVFLAVSEVVGHLDLLAERGWVEFEGQEGPWLAEPRITPAGLHSTFSCRPGGG